MGVGEGLWGVSDEGQGDWGGGLVMRRIGAGVGGGLWRASDEGLGEGGGGSIAFLTPL